MNVLTTKTCVLVLIYCDNIVNTAASIGYEFGIYENSRITMSIVHDDISDLRDFQNMKQLLLKTGMAYNSPIY